MTGVRVAINGFGTIGKRVAKAVQAQPDMIVSGVTKTGPSHGCALAERFGIPLYCTDDSPERIMSFDGTCLLYTSPSPRDVVPSRMPSSA